MKNEPYILDKKLTSSQKKVEIEKVQVHFPFEPYQVQMEYMKKVIEKTFCLLS